MFYYNPNIYPSNEYWYRVEEQQKIIDLTDAKQLYKDDFGKVILGEAGAAVAAARVDEVIADARIGASSPCAPLYRPRGAPPARPSRS